MRGCPAPRTGARGATKQAVKPARAAIQHACATFASSETCYGYVSARPAENNEIADWLSHSLAETMAEVQAAATALLWTYDNERPNMALGHFRRLVLLLLQSAPLFRFICRVVGQPLATQQDSGLRTC